MHDVAVMGHMAEHEFSHSKMKVHAVSRAVAELMQYDRKKELNNLVSLHDLSDIMTKRLSRFSPTRANVRTKRQAQVVKVPYSTRMAPVDHIDFQCLYYPLIVDATNIFDITYVNYTKISRERVTFNVSYTSPTNEEIGARATGLTEIRDFAPPEYCNSLWKAITPLRVREQVANFTPKLLKHRGKTNPKLCLSAIDWVETEIQLGSSETCLAAPYKDYIHNMYSFPATEYTMWECGGYLYDHLPAGWVGTCSPYWLLQPANFTPVSYGGKIEIPRKEGLTEIDKEDDDAVNKPILPGDEFVQVPEQAVYSSISDELGTSSNHPFYSNLWFRNMESRVRKVTQSSCYACSMLPRSAENVFPQVAMPLMSGTMERKGAPTVCTLIFQYVLYMHPLLKDSGVLYKMNSLVITLFDVERTIAHNGQADRILTFAAHSEISVLDKDSVEKTKRYTTTFKLPGDYPKPGTCSNLLGEHVLHRPADLDVKPLHVSAAINKSAIFEVCVSSGLPIEDQTNLKIGYLKQKQCQQIITLSHDLSILAMKGVAQTPNLFWCCGRKIWVTLPRKWLGLCGVCTLNELTFMVQPIGALRQNSSHVHKRGVDEYIGYVHLFNKDPRTLAAKYHDLPAEYKPFTMTQLFFKTWFASTSLQYDNHYLIMITRHDLVKLSNETIRGFQAIGSEINRLKEFVNNNRMALDYLTAKEGGVCALVGDDGCCTYLPSLEEGNDNLTLAIRNLQNLNQEVVQAHLDAKEASGFTFGHSWLDSIVDFFKNNSIFGWIIGIFTPILVIIIIAGILICCCLPLIRAFILKSVSNSFTVIHNPRIMNCNPPPSPRPMYNNDDDDHVDNTDDTSTCSSESLEVPVNPDRYRSYHSRMDDVD